ncbi:hypothetical protein HPULCUR_008578 [Helicostylum pulchrum]|uniref:NUA/TPR/MLP1-2-like domain-containing protein n=1 Tax=Helicostylum pulchrum TaxID=562976 RepID=A0ABP9Y8C3_9FUNG
MFTGDDTEGLKKALEYETLQEQYNKLQQLFNEISEKNTALQSEAETTKNELNTLKTQTETTESSKRELEIKCASLANQEKQLRDIIDTTFQQLNEKRDALQRAHTDLGELRLKLTQTTVDADTIRSDVSKITDEKNELERKYAFSVKRETEINERLLSVQRDYDNFRKDNETDRTKCEEQINYLRKEKDTASDYAEELRLQLEHSKQSVVDLESKYTQVVAERDQLTLNMASASKAYKELLALYEEHVVHNDENMSKLESEITALTAEKDSLQTRYSTLERSLEEERDLRRAQLQQFTGGPGDTTTTSKSSSNLLDLIRDYQKLNRHPEDIYQDFFELREKYQKVLSNATQASNVAETMTRKLNENQNLFNRLYRELEDSKSKAKKLSHTVSAEEAKRSELEKSNKLLKNTVSDLTDEKKNLEASLNDTTYQLQYLLSDVQRRNAPIPSAVRESAELLTAIQVSPSIPHDQLIFKDVAELQDLNTKLVSEVRTLREQVTSTSNEISHANTKRNSDVEFYKNALNEAKQTITSLSSTSEDLQKQLNTLTSECNNYKNLISQLGDGDVSNKFEQMQHRQELQRKEMDITFESYCTETTIEINKLKEELSTARTSASEAKAQLTQVNVEIANLRRKQINLSSRLEQREKELQSCQRENHNLQECIVSRDLELSNTKSELIDFKKRTDRLSDENISLNSRLESTTAAYNATKETMGSQSINHSHMNNLLETINHRMEVFADTTSENAKQYKDTIEKLNRDLQHARHCLSIAEKELDGYKSIDQQEIKDKYNTSVIEIGLLKTKISDLEKQVSNVNQERIIAQTKLATAEEQIKALTATIEGTNASSDVSSSDSNTCNEHLRLLAQAEDRIRTLESDIENYHTVITSNENKIELLAKERADMATQNQEAIDKLLKELEIKTAAVDIVQTEADKSIAEYKTLHEKVLSTQAELIQEKTELQERVQVLDTENTAKENELQAQRQVVEEKTSALNEVEGKLDAQTKTAEEYRQTIATLRADVSNLTFEITEYKSKAEAATASVESVTANYKREAAEWAEFEDNLKKNLAESEKQREELVNRVETLVKKYDEWQSSVNNEANIDSTAFDGATTDIIRQLRDANKLLRIERDANESKYRYEHDNLRRAEAEMDRVKKQVEYLQTDCERLRQETKSYNQKHSADTEDCKMRCDAFMSQNHKLTQENKRLKEREERAQAELEKKIAEMNPLINKVSALEAQLKLTQEENEMLNKSQQEWSSRSAQLLSKYNRIDPAEIDRVKSELETTKQELETVKAEKVALEKNVEDLQAQAKKFDTERAGLVTKSNDRGRLAFEFKKKFMEAEKKFTESEKKLSESEKKLFESESKLKESENKLKLAETASVTASTQINNNSNAVKEMETLEEEKKKAEESLKTRMDEYTALEKKYNSILHRARQLQQEKIKSLEELKTLRAETPTLKAKIAELEANLVNVNKTLTDNSIELTRLKAQNSMIVNKNNRLQKELDVIKTQASSSALSAAASALQASSSPMAESPSASPIINTPMQDVSTPPIQITTSNIEAAVTVTAVPEVEESAVATPCTDADVDIEELNGTPVTELEDALDEEEEATNAEVTEDIAATEVTEEVSETPAVPATSTEVVATEAVTETVSTEVGEIAVTKEDSTTEAIESTSHVEEDLAEANQDSTVAIGEKRTREEDGGEGEVGSPPPKKVEI